MSTVKTAPNFVLYVRFTSIAQLFSDNEYEESDWQHVQTSPLIWVGTNHTEPNLRPPLPNVLKLFGTSLIISKNGGCASKSSSARIYKPTITDTASQSEGRKGYLSIRGSSKASSSSLTALANRAIPQAVSLVTASRFFRLPLILFLSIRNLHSLGGT